eukprot:CAMPEP_0183297472 /NCGR_PEP_ID=MMETSP0160_2-20130417/4763_1 /TAXON_ID=2839 ORGANISM="Odontella Sinensis, Strain Grunow 1884" /NCGR_SAMPLE_ID=MMETSP0160_2 /ASSEMBLY_ACC=CAM_ASM_000250 /LENGTH=293 /DNA_ID=CAMNT_0025459303 /DNA_START=56 /DNA_END=938 /DNA_ORIENTATION=-
MATSTFLRANRMARALPGPSSKLFSIPLCRASSANVGILQTVRNVPKGGSVAGTRRMTTAYGGEPGDGRAGLEDISYLPHRTRLPGGRAVEVGPFRESEWRTGMDLMNLIIREGRSWPFEEEFESVESYRGYFLSHAAFVVRSVDAGVDAMGNASPPGDVMGCFYVKPNFPGRCSHVCNGGFITAPNHRRAGVARIMGRLFLVLARDLGYKSSYFNLVFKSNPASVALWESLGFERVAVLERAARLKGVEGLDTAYGYRFDLESLDDDFYLNEPNGVPPNKKTNDPPSEIMIQ